MNQPPDFSWNFTAVVVAGIMAAGMLFVMTGSYDDEKHQEAWNCDNFPTAFTYCADVLSTRAK